MRREEQHGRTLRNAGIYGIEVEKRVKNTEKKCTEEKEFLE